MYSRREISLVNSLLLSLVHLVEVQRCAHEWFILGTTFLWGFMTYPLEIENLV